MCVCVWGGGGNLEHLNKRELTYKKIAVKSAGKKKTTRIDASMFAN